MRRPQTRNRSWDNAEGVGLTPWSAADAHVGLLALRKMQRDGGVPRGPGGSAPPTYSQRSAVIGSTLEPCHAGMAHAIPDTRLSRSTPASRMAGSREFPLAHRSEERRGGEEG